MKHEKAFLGLDLGTSSVGWCVTDENYKILKKNGKTLSGVRLFKEAESCRDRRLSRTARRRYHRRRERILLLQSLFDDEINKLDPNFFQRLEASKYHYEDKPQPVKFKQTLFISKDYNDSNFYNDYPTIYHLRQALIEQKDKKFDLRLIYLALHHTIKYRGHFLYPGEKYEILNREELSRFLENINSIIKEYDDNLNLDIDDSTIDNLIDISKQKISKTRFKEEIWQIFGSTNKFVKKNLAPLLSGSKISFQDIANIFNVEIDLETKKHLNFDSETYEQDLEEFNNTFTDDNICEIVICLKAIYDSLFIGKLISGHSWISEAMVDIYQEHQNDLKTLKNLFKNDREKYRDIFSSESENNYPSYVGHPKKKHPNKNFKICSRDNFYKFIKNKLELIDDCQEKTEVQEKIESKTFLLKQNSTDNSMIPYQLNLAEVKEILKNQSAFYPFLLLQDEDELNVIDKIISIITFRIPFYVGPLAYNKANNSFSWCKRKIENTKIYPWNFDKVIDKEVSAERFITRMVSRCTYLPNEFCLPKDSLIYSFYNFFNEINKILVNGTPLSTTDKKELIYLSSHERLTKARLKKYFQQHYDSEILITSANGKELEEFSTDLKSWRDFVRIFDGNEKNVCQNLELIEKIILDIVIFTDKEILKERLLKENLDGKTIEKICNLKYSGYGRLSKKLLFELKTPFIDNGEEKNKSILEIMFLSNQNFMEIIYNSNYSFKTQIEAENSSHAQDISVEEYIDQQYVSPGMKRSLLQAFKIVAELRDSIGNIDDFYIECNREHSNDKSVPLSRKTKILSLYKSLKSLCKEDYKKVKELEQEINQKNDLDLRSKKLYLYFMQLGRSMYSLKPISIEEINTRCDIDHVVPQSLLKDDSIDNMVLVYSEENKAKGSTFPYRIENEEFYKFCKLLLKNGMMSSKKFSNLTRKQPFEPEEQLQFVNRQLVYTSQAVKALVDLINRFCGVDKSHIIYSKAGLVSDFRRDFDLLKVRSANKFHHAHDAYLNIVVGRTMTAYFGQEFTKKNLDKLREKRLTTNINKIFDNKIITDKYNLIAWEKDKTIEAIRQTIERERYLNFTHRAYINNGLLSKISITRAKCFKSGLALKNPKNSCTPLANFSRYGGYSSLEYGYYVLAKAQNKKTAEIIAMPNVIVKATATLEEKEEYLRKKYNNKKYEIILPLLKINTVIKRGQSSFCITGKTGDSYCIKNLIEPFFDQSQLKLLKNLEKLQKLKYPKEILNDCDEIILSPQTLSDGKEKKITNDDLNKVFYSLTKKLSSNIYKSYSSFKTIRSCFENAKSQFDMLDMLAKAKFVYDFFRLFQTEDLQTVDLSMLGVSKYAAKLTCGSTLEKGDIIIAESVCGLKSKILYRQE